MGVRIHNGLLALGLALSVTTLSMSPAFAGWQDVASPADAGRLAQLPQIRADAWTAAERGGGRGDQRALARVMQAEGRTIPEGALIGNWRCRQIKLGGVASYMVYDGWFNCSIRSARGGLVLQKTNGSQRFIGLLYPDNGAWVYVGASSAKGEPWHRYSGNAPSLGADVTPDDQVGRLTGIGNNHLRLEIPAVQESLLDVVEFTR